MIERIGCFCLKTLPYFQWILLSSNYTDFTFKRDETFFHTGLGTGMWVDRSIAEAFAVEADKVYYRDGIVNFDGTLRMQVWKLHPVWRELVWGVLDSKKSK